MECEQIVETSRWLSNIDFFVIGGYLLVTIGIGLYFAKLGTKSIKTFYVGDRSMPWWLLGISLIATCSDAGMPMWIGDMIYRRGLEGMWLQWASAIGFCFFVFTIAPLWRRSGLITDIQVYETRYSGAPARFLRGLKCVYGALFINIMILAFSTLSITVIVEATTGIPKQYCMLILISSTMVYCVFSGLWGVAAADFLQFFVAIGGYIAVAVVSVKQVGGFDIMTEKLLDMKDWTGHSLNIMPKFSSGGLGIMTVGYLFMMRWIEQASRGGYVAQRLFATKSVKDAMLTALLFTFIYFAIIPFFWIITITASKVLLPDLQSGQEAYPLMALKFLPIGLKGLYIACMLAAFMSTFSTVLNWGSSYFINDLYRRFLVRNASGRHYLLAGQLVMLPMALVSGLIAFHSGSILNLTLYVLMAEAGIVTVSLASWLWWRVSAFSEIAALAGSFLLMIGMCIFIPHWVTPENMEYYYGHRLFFVALGTIVIWLIVTFITPPTDRKTLENFYTRLRPMGYWKPVSCATNTKPMFKWSDILLGTTSLMVATFGVGFGLLKLVFQETAFGLALITAGTAGLIIAIRKVLRQDYEL